MPLEEFEAKLGNLRERMANEKERVTTDLVRAGSRAHGNHRAQGIGENEWYTPAEYIAAVRDVLGSIDLDPASSAAAQESIAALQHYTARDDGLSQQWHGRIWLNPPYSKPLIKQFVAKLVSDFCASRVTEAILLTHNYTDTAWFHVAACACSALCFTRGRIKFVDAQGVEAAPTQGQAFFYFGARPARFAARFGGIGFVTRPISCSEASDDIAA
jgi:ParB family chromosome partitioning protein